MNFDSVSVLLLAVAFLVPGFILSSVLATKFRRRSSSPADLTLQYLTLSCLNHGFWSWLIVLMIQWNWLDRFPGRSAMLAFLMLVVSPITMGLVAVALSGNQRVLGLLSALGFKARRFIPTAWDFKFEQERLSWVVVRLKDGTTVYGFWGPRSFAGDEPDQRDLYLEATFLPGTDGQWQPVPETGGILIAASEIATVEFRQLASGEGAP